MNLIEWRAALAGALNEIEFSPSKPLKVTANPVKGNLKQRDGWVIINTVTPDDFARSFLGVLNAYVVLGSDEKIADEKFSILAVPMVNAAINLGGMDVSVQPQAMIAGESVPGEIYVLALTASFEITS